MKIYHIIIAVTLFGLIFLLKLTENDFETVKIEAEQDIADVHEIQNSISEELHEIFLDSKAKNESIHELDSVVMSKNGTIEEYTKELEKQLVNSEADRKLANEMKDMADSKSELAREMEMYSQKARMEAEHRYHILETKYQDILVELEVCKKDSVPLTLTITDTIYVNKSKRKN